MVGSATLTTVWSIMIIDSAPVMVASTHQRPREAAGAGRARARWGSGLGEGGGGHGTSFGPRAGRVLSSRLRKCTPAIA